MTRCKWEVAIRNSELGDPSWPQHDPREWFAVHPCRTVTSARALAASVLIAHPHLITAVRPRTTA